MKSNCFGFFSRWRRIKSKSLFFGTEDNEHLKAHKIRLKPEKKEVGQKCFKFSQIDH